MKTAIFVEGQTELILVREMLLKLFDYQNISLECFNLFSVESLHPVEYAFPNEKARYHFQIINVGNDNAVLDRLLKRENSLWKAGFDRIIGLRDMYSSAYKEIVGASKINEEVNAKFKEGHQAQIDDSASRPEQIYFRFAIMEAEAWLLGLPSIFEKTDQQLTIDFIEQQLGYNLKEIDPETTFFHPANQIEAIFGLVGKTYSKSKGDVNAMVSFIKKVDYSLLNSKEKCNSFTEFYEIIPKVESIE